MSTHSFDLRHIHFRVKVYSYIIIHLSTVVCLCSGNQNRQQILVLTDKQSSYSLLVNRLDGFQLKTAAAAHRVPPNEDGSPQGALTNNTRHKDR